MKKLFVLFILLLVFVTFKIDSVNAKSMLDINSKIIKSLETDLTGDGKTENVILSGVSLNDSPLYENIKITVSDNKTGVTLFSIIPTTNVGYEPSIMLGDFTGDGLYELFYASSSGDGVGYYYLYTFNEDYSILYDYERDITSFTASYEDWYKLKVYNKDNAYLVDLSTKEKEISSIYNNGIVTDTINAKIKCVSNAYPCYDYLSKTYNLLVVRNIVTNSSGVTLCKLVESYNYTNKEKVLTESNVIIV